MTIVLYRLNELKEGLLIAFSAINANKMRSVLTTLGIVIGIVVVTLMATVIEGLGKALDKSISSLGSDVYYISKWDWFGNEWWKSRNRREITMQEYAQFKERFTRADAVVPVASSWGKTFKFRKTRKDVSFLFLGPWVGSVAELSKARIDIMER